MLYLIIQFNLSIDLYKGIAGLLEAYTLPSVAVIDVLATLAPVGMHQVAYTSLRMFL